MKVIRHQCEGEDLNRMTGLGNCEDGKKSFVVLSFVKHRRAAVSSVDYMIRVTGLLPARDSRHNRALSRLRLLPQQK